jgi:putative phosphoesterase
VSRNVQCKEGRIIAVLSDTHGTLSAEAIEVLGNADLIIHAGDIDTPDVLEALRGIGPVVAVQGNMDGGPWTKGLSRTEMVEIEDVRIYVLHNIDRLDLDPRAAGFDAVISGHTHRPDIREDRGVLFLNPGSAAWPKAKNLPTMALICVKERSMKAEIVVLRPGSDE